MKRSLIALAVFTTFSIGIAEPVEEERRRLHRFTTSAIPEGLTLRDQLTLSWKTKAPENLPTAVTITNPFQEDITVFTAAEMPYFGPGDQLVLEYFDPVLSQWRVPQRRNPLLTFSSERTELAKGASAKLTLPRMFWRGLEEHPLSQLAKFRLRVAFDFRGVVLRSEVFEWNPANKTQK